MHSKNIFNIGSLLESLSTSQNVTIKGLDDETIVTGSAIGIFEILDGREFNQTVHTIRLIKETLIIEVGDDN